MPPQVPGIGEWFLAVMGRWILLACHIVCGFVLLSATTIILVFGKRIPVSENVNDWVAIILGALWLMALLGWTLLVVFLARWFKKAHPNWHTLRTLWELQLFAIPFYGFRRYNRTIAICWQNHPRAE